MSMIAPRSMLPMLLRHTAAAATAAAVPAAARPGALAACMHACAAQRSVSVSAAAASSCRLLSCQPCIASAKAPVSATPMQPPSLAAMTAAAVAAAAGRGGHATHSHTARMSGTAAHDLHGSMLRPPMQRHVASCGAAAAPAAPGMYMRSALPGGPPRLPAPHIHTRTYSSDDRSAAVSRLARASRHREQRAAAKPPAVQATGAPAVPSGGAVVPSETQASEAQVQQVLGHPALVVTRPIEWGTVVFGFEQANKYQVLDEQGNLVALIAEDQTGIGNEIGRQVLRTHRSFTATVLSADGTQVICRVRRPAYLITSTMYIEDGEGNTVGEVHRRWSAINRNYDLYLNKKQFASITGSFLAWEFELKDGDGRSLAFIDRNFMGFGKEIFTDAGQYAIHFGLPAAEAEKMVSNVEQAKASQAQASPPPSPLKPLGPGAAADDKALVIPTQAGNMLQVARRLHVDERMITLACAISIDYDFFSRHSHGHGMMGGMMPIIPMPMPYPGAPPAGSAPEGGPGPGDGPSGGAAGGAAGAAGAAGTDTGGGGAGMPPPPQQQDGGAGGEENSGWGWGSEGQGGGGQGAGWSGNDQEITWDNGGGGGGDGDDGGGGSIVGTLWGWVTGSDE